ncbi:hypothetical protein GRAN_3416 [Granulicella sibirica]|uniref:Uncharacterized protein n=2 Tax=Granulicella sibirica TaxID=2479048 RepID=A0A4Q0T3K3_9BACT|nr:hypothetical protein GRAN_3416 [Granulicella sibirica]
MKVALSLLFLLPQAHPQETLHAYALEEVHITGNCHIYHLSTADGKPIYFKNANICHQESKFDTMQPEENLKNGVMTKVVYEIKESEYLLHDFTDHPVAFVLDQPLPDGWQVVSDPQPLTTDNHMAIYRVLAQPGQTVRLHTGQRRQVDSRVDHPK